MLGEINRFIHEKSSPKHIINLRNINGENLLSVFCKNGNLEGVELVHDLGGNLKYATENEMPIQICIRWGYKYLIKFFLRNKVHSKEELEDIFDKDKFQRYSDLILEYYPNFKPKKKASN